MKCFNPKTQELFADNLKMHDTYFSRLIGLMFKKNLPSGSGIILKPCTQIHTCFMRFNIDVIFLDKDLKVVHVIENMPPWRISPLFLKSRYTIELPSGTLKGRIKKGEILALSL
ncbi:MAG: DUF192 domain-containing protein [Elusimicrobiaceae bacterium]|nr:DUF192 domain-containing protein [Elusimicrobiaceae bacterium]